MDPYALGLLLGDGCLTTSTTPAFATGDPELALALEQALDGIPFLFRAPSPEADRWIAKAGSEQTTAVESRKTPVAVDPWEPGKFAMKPFAPSQPPSR